MPSFTSSLRPMLHTARTAALSARSFSSSTPRSVARMIITGRLGTDPELTATASGHEVVKYVVGTSYGSAANRHTSWFRISSFQSGPAREHLLSLPKGTLVYVEGDANLRTYDDDYGKKQTVLNIAQRSLEVLRRPYPQDSNTQDQAASGENFGNNQ